MGKTERRTRTALQPAPARAGQSTMGEFIRFMRKQAGMTQKELADMLHVTDKAVSKWERGLSFPDILLLPELAGIFGVSVGELIGVADDGQTPARLKKQYEMSSDLRAPLHIILGCAELLGECMLPDFDDTDEADEQRNPQDSQPENLQARSQRTRQGSQSENLQGSSQRTRQGSQPENQQGGPLNRQRRDGADDSERVRRYLEAIRISGEHLLSVLDTRIVSEPAGRLEDQLGKTGEARRNAAEEYDFGDRLILVAEDIFVNREIVRQLLMPTGARLEFAEDGKGCLSMIKNKPAGYYDLILMDLMMPNMDGFEAARKIRAMRDPGKAGIPIVAMTANASDEDRRAAFEAGMDDFAEKPILVDKLLQMMSQCFRRK